MPDDFCVGLGTALEGGVDVYWIFVLGLSGLKQTDVGFMKMESEEDDTPSLCKRLSHAGEFAARILYLLMESYYLVGQTQQVAVARAEPYRRSSGLPI